MFPGEALKILILISHIKDGVCEVPINADIIFSIVDKDGTKTRAKR